MIEFGLYTLHADALFRAEGHAEKRGVLLDELHGRVLVQGGENSVHLVKEGMVFCFRIALVTSHLLGILDGLVEPLVDHCVQVRLDFTDSLNAQPDELF